MYIPFFWRFIKTIPLVLIFILMTLIRVLSDLFNWVNYKTIEFFDFYRKNI